MMDIQYMYDCEQQRHEDEEQAYHEYMTMFWEQHNKRVFLRREDLRIGDIIILSHKSHTIEAGDRLLGLKPSQGYYTFQLVGGARYQQFLRTPERVARWTGREWHWKK